jgi:hypothetical protein
MCSACDRKSAEVVEARVERTEWFQNALDDPAYPSNQGPGFKPRAFGNEYTEDGFFEDPRGPRVLVYPGDLPEANLVASLTRTNKHAPVIDLDIPAKLVPSKTEGHYHLYIDKELSWEQYRNLLYAMCCAGIVEWNYYHAAQQAQMTFVRKDPTSRPDRAEAAKVEPKYEPRYSFGRGI